MLVRTVTSTDVARRIAPVWQPMQLQATAWKIHRAGIVHSGSSDRLSAASEAGAYCDPREEPSLDQQGLELSKNAARAAAPFAGGLGIAFLLIGLIPVCGGCITFLISLAAFAGVAYLITPKMTYLPPGQSKAMLSLYIGLGVGAVITIAFVIASILISLVWMGIGAAFDSLNSPGGVFGGAVGLVLGAIVSLIFGLIIGTGLAFLGSYLAFNKMPDQQNVMRPF
jgi:hypothetical protein